MSLDLTWDEGCNKVLLLPLPLTPLEYELLMARSRSLFASVKERDRDKSELFGT